MKYTMLICLGVLLLVSCGSRTSAIGGEQRNKCAFIIPVPPVMMSGVSERAEYIAEHYWQGLDYTDTAWLADSLALEQVFVDWISVLAKLPQETRVRVAGTVITHGKSHTVMQVRLGELAELYFYEPDSPYRNEELYIPILDALIASPYIEDIYKERYRFQLEKALRNRPGTQAADFKFITKQMQVQQLSDIHSDYILILFFNPDCHDCKRVIDYINSSNVFSILLKNKCLTILAVYPDEDLGAWKRYLHSMPNEWIVARYESEADRCRYYLPAIPSLYLLDVEKKVILKDAPVELIEAWLEGKI